MSNPTQEALQANAIHEREIKARQIAEAYERVFKSPDGQVVLTDLRESFGTNYPAFLQKDGYNPTVAAIRDGQRQVYLHIEAALVYASKPDTGNEKPNVIKP
jgi:hypothetical protein